MLRTQQSSMLWQKEHSSTQISADKIELLVPEKEERPPLMLEIQIQFPSSVTYAPDCSLQIQTW